MFPLSNQMGAAKASLTYITIGALTEVWSGVWYWYMSKYPPQADSTWFWCWGFLLTGLALIIIGLAVGSIGRSARHAEVAVDSASIVSASPSPPPANAGTQPMAPAPPGTTYLMTVPSAGARAAPLPPVPVSPGPDSPQR